MGLSVHCDAVTTGKREVVARGWLLRALTLGLYLGGGRLQTAEASVFTFECAFSGHPPSPPSYSAGAGIDTQVAIAQLPGVVYTSSSLSVNPSITITHAQQSTALKSHSCWFRCWAQDCAPPRHADDQSRIPQTTPYNCWASWRDVLGPRVARNSTLLERAGSTIC